MNQLSPVDVSSETGVENTTVGPETAGRGGEGQVWHATRHEPGAIEGYRVCTYPQITLPLLVK